MTATYQITAGDFSDPSPAGGASLFVEGTYTFTFDTSIALQYGIMPDEVIGLDISDQNGNVADYDEFNSGMDASFNIFTDSARLTNRRQHEYTVIYGGVKQ